MADYQAWVQPYRDVADKQFRHNEASRQEFDDFFSRLEQMAAGCSDQMVFNEQFQQGPFAKEYNDLFVKYVSLMNVGDGQAIADTTKDLHRQALKSAAVGMAGSMAESVATRKAEEALTDILPDEVNDTRREATALRSQGLRAIPVLGSIIQWADNIQWIRRMFKKG